MATVADSAAKNLLTQTGLLMEGNNTQNSFLLSYELSTGGTRRRFFLAREEV
jgi:hypothetical protein